MCVCRKQTNKETNKQGPKTAKSTTMQCLQIFRKIYKHAGAGAGAWHYLMWQAHSLDPDAALKCRLTYLIFLLLPIFPAVFFRMALFVLVMRLLLLSKAGK